MWKFLELLYMFVPYFFIYHRRNVEMNNFKTEQPFSYFITENDEALLFHVMNVGQGLMILLVFPDQTTMLFDCYLKKENEEAIIDYLGQSIPFREDETGNDSQWIDIFVNSHRDKDHYQGLKTVNSYFPIKSIWDSGQYGTGAQSGNDEYKYYMYLKNKIKKTYGEEAVPKLVPSSQPFRTFDVVHVYCLNSKEDFEDDQIPLFSLNESFIKYSNDIPEEQIVLLEKYALKDQHTNCIVLMIDYSGKRILLTGDSDWHSWKEYIVPNFEDSNLIESDILIASHHGSRSFFTDESNSTIDIEANPDTTFLDHINIINPQLTLISCGEYSTHHHPNSEAVTIYKDATAHSQVYTTNEKGATFTGFITNEGYWGITTSDFKNHKTHNEIDFKLDCVATINGKDYIIEPGDTISTTCKLKFKASTIRGIADSIVSEDVSVTWEVSNSGRNNDESHQEIYYIGKQKKKCFYSVEEERELMYDGIHLLRCTIENKDRNKKITKILKIEGAL
jgi:beta-lactamase superfamily II metal-dependent hydrolase